MMRFRARRCLLAILFSTCSFLGLNWINVTRDVTSDTKREINDTHPPQIGGDRAEFSTNIKINVSKFLRSKENDTKDEVVNIPKYSYKTKFSAKVSKFLRLKENDTKDEFVNLHKYSYKISSNKCQGQDIFLIVLVHSALGNVHKRHMVRTTYGSVTSYTGKHIVLVFMLGATHNSFLQKDIDKEFLEHGDIVQGNFHDSYKNLVQKHIMSIHWYRHHCNASYILKVDDDTFINPFRLVEYILKTKPNGLNVHGQTCHNHLPIRIKTSKYYTSMSEYPFPRLPTFCLGFAYLTTPETWNAMYDAMKKLSMDDVYVTGVLGMIIGVQHHSLRPVMYTYKVGEAIDVDLLNKMVLFYDGLDYCKGKAFLHWSHMVPPHTNLKYD